MSIARQLYQLQDIDLEIESNERSLTQNISQLGESQEITSAQSRLASGKKQLDELKHQQSSVEWDIDDLSSKITAAEKELYSGRTANPKELTSLQHEVKALKAKREQLENGALEIMSQVELAEAGIAATGSELNKLEDEWRGQQRQLSNEIDQLKIKLAELREKRQLLLSVIDTQAVESYEKLRREKGQAVARVEQGICRSCRISLPFSGLQQARGGKLVQCSSCGRILFLP